jgi:hypothetical protein
MPIKILREIRPMTSTSNFLIPCNMVQYIVSSFFKPKIKTKIVEISDFHQLYGLFRFYCTCFFYKEHKIKVNTNYECALFN